MPFTSAEKATKRTRKTAAPPSVDRCPVKAFGVAIAVIPDHSRPGYFEVTCTSISVTGNRVKGVQTNNASFVTSINLADRFSVIECFLRVVEVIAEAVANQDNVFNGLPQKPIGLFIGQRDATPINPNAFFRLLFGKALSPQFEKSEAWWPCNRTQLIKHFKKMRDFLIAKAKAAGSNADWLGDAKPTIDFFQQSIDGLEGAGSRERTTRQAARGNPRRSLHTKLQLLQRYAVCLRKVPGILDRCALEWGSFGSNGSSVSSMTSKDRALLALKARLDQGDPKALKQLKLLATVEGISDAEQVNRYPNLFARVDMRDAQGNILPRSSFFAWHPEIERSFYKVFDLCLARGLSRHYKLPHHERRAYFVDPLADTLQAVLRQIRDSRDPVRVPDEPKWRAQLAELASTTAAELSSATDGRPPRRWTFGGSEPAHFKRYSWKIVRALPNRRAAKILGIPDWSVPVGVRHKMGFDNLPHLPKRKQEADYPQDKTRRSHNFFSQRSRRTSISPSGGSK